MTVIESFRLARSVRTPKPRKSVVKAFAAYLGRKLPGWTQVRTTVLQISGIGCIDFAAFQWSTMIGFFAVGISLFILEALSGE